jgi:hypothetical protein
MPQNYETLVTLRKVHSGSAKERNNELEYG